MIMVKPAMTSLDVLASVRQDARCRWPPIT